MRVTAVSEVDHDLRFYIFFTFLTAAIVERRRYLVQAQRKVTLHCGNEKLGQKQCKGTTWMFSNGTSSAALELFKYGEITKDGKERSDRLRLSLTANCSLVIKKVTVEDAGSYTCQQWSRTKESTEDIRLADDSTVDLSVVTGESLSVNVFTSNSVVNKVHLSVSHSD